MYPFKNYKNILEKYIDQNAHILIENSWKEPHRIYHNVNHLIDILKYIEERRFQLNPIHYDILILSAFFHDVYYNPRDHKNNEDESIKLFLSSYTYKNLDIRNVVIEIINATKYRKRPKQPIVRLFWDADNNGFYKKIPYFINKEKQIREEYKHVPKNLYKKERIKFIKSNLGLFNNNVDKNLNKLIEYINDKY